MRKYNKSRAASRRHDRRDDRSVQENRCNGSFTKDVTVLFLQVLRAEFGENLVVVLDRASFFSAKKVKRFVEDAKTD